MTVKLLLILIAAISLVVIVERWRWDECRRVGHGALYCVLESGEGER